MLTSLADFMQFVPLILILIQSLALLQLYSAFLLSLFDKLDSFIVYILYYISIKNASISYWRILLYYNINRKVCMLKNYNYLINFNLSNSQLLNYKLKPSG